MGINFDSNSFYGNDDNKYIKTEIKIFKDRVDTNFYNEKYLKKKYLKKMYHTNIY